VRKQGQEFYSFALAFKQQIDPFLETNEMSNTSSKKTQKHNKQALNKHKLEAFDVAGIQPPTIEDILKWKKESKTRKTPENRPKKTMNAFIIFRLHCLKTIKKELQIDFPQHMISTFAQKWWSNHPYKNRYRDLSEELKTLAYDGYNPQTRYFATNHPYENIYSDLSTPLDPQTQLNSFELVNENHWGDPGPLYFI